MRSSKKIYEIQFLRAVAVLFVIFFHLFPDKFVGGYIGVDIFFVISGFLITKILNKKKPISIFYLNRLKRIFPTLSVVVIFSCVLSLFILYSEASSNFLHSSFSSIFFYSNFYFWITSQEYFGVQKIYQPLLHTWSLSLEFQFYLLAPFVIKIIKKFKKNETYILLVMIIISLFFSYNFLGRAQSFYMLPYRLNEFLLGSLLYYFRRFNFSNFFCDIIFFISIILLIYLALVYDQKNFPGIKGFFVCLLIFTVLYFNNFQYALILIKNRFIQHIGNISYSLFLLHWPLIVFANYIKIAELTNLEKTFLLLIIFLFSNILYYYIENFFIKKSLKDSINKIKLLYLYSIILVFISIILVKDNVIWNLRLNPKKVELLKMLKKDNPNLLGLKNDDGFKDINNVKKNILIFGDSHAADIHFSLKLIDNRFNYLYVSNDLGCAEMLSKKLTIHWFEKFANLLFGKRVVSKYLFEDCLSKYKKLDILFSKYEIDKVFLSMRWNNSEVHNVDFIVNYFQNRGLLNSIYIFSRRLEIKDPERAILFGDNELLSLNTFIDKNKILFEHINKNLINKAKNLNIKFVDINKYILDNDGRFEFLNKKSNNVYYIDYSHFSLNGGKLYLKKFYDDYLF